MSDRNRCSRLTLKGRPCRNPAARGTDPPVCARHMDKGAPSAVQRHFYFPRPSADERRAVEEGGPAADLQAEITLVRIVLRRVLSYLDEAAEELPAEEVRRLSSLIFTGARTVAHLLAQRSVQPDELRNWMEEAMSAIADEKRGSS